MSEEQIRKFGMILNDVFFQPQIIPKTIQDLLIGTLAPGNETLRQELARHWQAKNKERQARGQAAIDAKMPFHLSRGFGETMAEEELKHYLPEEKIMINQEIFRKKLAKIDFSTLEGARERGLIEELRQESIGLSKDDTVLYYNLIKLDFLAKRSKSSGAERPEATIDYPGTIVRLIVNQFGLNDEGLTKMNNGKPLDLKMISSIVTENIRITRTNPAIMVNYLGLNTPRFVEKLKDFIKLAVDSRDGNLSEIYQHTGLYLLLNGTKPEILAKLGLSTPLEAFINDRIGRVRQIYYVAMLFAYTLTYVLFVQVYEIASKFQQTPDEQKPKLRKLYESDERLAMLVANASNIAARKIADYKVEAREVQTLLKKFLGSGKGLVSAVDLFGSSYEIQ